MSKFGNKVSIAFNRVEWVTNFGTHFMLPNSLESDVFKSHIKKIKNQCEILVDGITKWFNIAICILWGIRKQDEKLNVCLGC